MFFCLLKVLGGKMMSAGALSANAFSPLRSNAMGALFPSEAVNPMVVVLPAFRRNNPTLETNPARPASGGEAMLREVARYWHFPRHIIRMKQENASAASPQQGSDAGKELQQSGGTEAAALSPIKANIEAALVPIATTSAFNPLWGSPERMSLSFAASTVAASDRYPFRQTLGAEMTVKIEATLTISTLQLSSTAGGQWPDTDANFSAGVQIRY
jgi:hypothetical protein